MCCTHAGRSSAGHGRRTSASRPSKRMTQQQSAHGAIPCKLPGSARRNHGLILVYARRCIYWFVLALFTLAERVSDVLVFWSVSILPCLTLTERGCDFADLHA